MSSQPFQGCSFCKDQIAFCNAQLSHSCRPEARLAVLVLSLFLRLCLKRLELVSWCSWKHSIRTRKEIISVMTAMFCKYVGVNWSCFISSVHWYGSYIKGFFLYANHQCSLSFTCKKCTCTDANMLVPWAKRTYTLLKSRNGNDCSKNMSCSPCS